MADINSAFTTYNGISLDDIVGLFQGTDDPTSGAGEAAPVGSLFLRTNGELYQKTGAADTAWTQLGAGGGSVTLEPYAIHNDVVTQVLTGTPVDLFLGTENIGNTFYTNTSGRITISETGTYDVQFTVTCNGPAGGFFGAGSAADGGLYIDDVLVPGTVCGGYSRADAANYSFSKRVKLNLTAGEDVSVKVSLNTGTASTVANACNMVISKAEV